MPFDLRAVAFVTDEGYLACQYNDAGEGSGRNLGGRMVAPTPGLVARSGRAAAAGGQPRDEDTCFTDPTDNVVHGKGDGAQPLIAPTAL